MLRVIRTRFGEAVPVISIPFLCFLGGPGKSWLTGSKIWQMSENWINEQIMLFSLDQHSMCSKSNFFGPHTISTNMYCQMYGACIFVNLFCLFCKFETPALLAFLEPLLYPPTGRTVNYLLLNMHWFVLWYQISPLRIECIVPLPAIC